MKNISLIKLFELYRVINSGNMIYLLGTTNMLPHGSIHAIPETFKASPTINLKRVLWKDLKPAILKGQTISKSQTVDNGWIKGLFKKST